MKKSSRELIHKKDIKILWGETFNRCMFNENGIFCTSQAIESKQDGEKYTLAEQAHISPHGEQGPRAGTKGDIKDGHKNRLILCPTHHKIVDEDTAKYTDEVMDEMKKRHILHYEEILNSIPTQIISKFKIEIQSNKFLDLVEYLNTFIVNEKYSKIEKEALFKSLNENATLLRHFLHNQKKDTLFMEIKDKLIPSIVIDQTDEQLKFKLLDYFTKNCIQTYSDEIIDILKDMVKNSQNIILKRSIGLFIEKLEPKLRFDILSEIACELISNTDQMVKEFTIRSIMKFIDSFNQDQLENISNSIFYTVGSEEDVTQQGLSLSLKFSGKDLQNASFRESANFLGKVLKNPKYVLYFIDKAMGIYDAILDKDTENFQDQDTTTIKYSYASWLPKTFPVKKSEFEYESEKMKRMGLEIWGALIELEIDKDILKQVCNTIINKARYSIYYEIINRFLSDKWDKYPDIIESIVFKKDLRSVIETTKPRRFKLFNNYLAQHTDKISYFEKLIGGYVIENKKAELHIKAELVSTIPEGKRSKKMKELKKQYEDRIKKEYKIDNYIIEEGQEDEYVGYATMKQSTFDISTLGEKKEIIELKNIIEEYVKSQNTFEKDIGDLAVPFKEYITKNADQLEELYGEIKGLDFKGRGQRLLGGLAGGYIDHYKGGERDKFYEELCKLYSIFSNVENINESQARLAIARSIEEGNDFLRSQDTGNLKESNPGIFAKIKELVINLAKDPDPKDNGDQQHVGLNSVRGIGTICISILCFYYPQEDDLIATIKLLSEDYNPGIQAQLISGLVYLINKRYDICKEIIIKLKNSDNVAVQNAIARYMFRLGNKKIEENVDLIEILCDSQENSVKNQVGDLVGQALLNDANIETIFGKIIKEEIGDDNVLESITMAFQNAMNSILSESDPAKKEKYLGYFENIIDFKSSVIEKNIAIRSRLGYCFHDADKRSDSSFDLLYKKGILNKLIKIPNQDTQKNLNKFFWYLAGKDMYLDDILDLLLLQMDYRLDNGTPIMLIDSWLNDEIIKIIDHVYIKTNKGETDLQMFSRAEKLFDEGLKYGEKGFYNIFDAYYRKED